MAIKKNIMTALTKATKDMMKLGSAEMLKVLEDNGYDIGNIDGDDLYYHKVAISNRFAKCNKIGLLPIRVYKRFDNNTQSFLEFSFSLYLGIFDESVKGYVMTKCDFKVDKSRNVYVTMDTDWRYSEKLSYSILWLNYKSVMEFVNDHSYYMAFIDDCCRKSILETNKAPTFDVISIFMTFPEMEILHKAGYKIAEKALRKNNRNESIWLDTFNRNFKSGNSPKEIIQLPQAYAKILKEIDDIKIYDNVRKLVKKKSLSLEGLKLMLDNFDVSYKYIAYIYDVLNKEYRGKPIFTVQSLMTYLARIDTYEAIPAEEGLLLLRDYLMMCKQLGIKPCIDGDSLKREHDVCARLAREKRNEIMAEKMQSACDSLQKFNYEEDIFFVRGIKNYDDLMSEAKMQHNCIACYADLIARKRSLIFTMREMSHPDKSLITIELSPDGQIIKQKFLAYNKPVRNKAQTDFINRWHKYVKETVKI